MKLQMFTIFDSCSGAFGRPVVMNTPAEATRMFCQLVISADSKLAESPEDYALYNIGEYDDANGIPQGCQPQRVLTGVEAVAMQRAKVGRLRELQGEIDALEGSNVEELDGSLL